MEKKNFTAVIICGGYSKRMNDFKATMKLDEKPVISMVLDEIEKSGIRNTIVVTGYGRKNIQPFISGRKGIREAFNPNFDKGMFSSIVKGIESAKEADGILLFPIDIPLVTSEAVEKLVAVIINSKENTSFAVPTFKGKKGHPLYIPSCFFDEILAYEGNRGLKGITEKYFDRMDFIETDEEGILLDMDTQEDFEILKEFLKNNRERESIKELAKDKEFVLIRHGTIKQHKSKIFLGQTDVSLSEAGRQEIRNLVKKLPEVKGTKIFTSPLLRAKESAEILIEDLKCKGKQIELLEVEGLKEMSLGDWDGKYIDNIKNEYPKEYEFRGENILRYKPPGKSENFYDLKYRVELALLDILKNTKDEQIVIVSHKGVIKVIEAMLERNDLENKANNEGIIKCGEYTIINY